MAVKRRSTKAAGGAAPKRKKQLDEDAKTREDDLRNENSGAADRDSEIEGDDIEEENRGEEGESLLNENEYNDKEKRSGENKNVGDGKEDNNESHALEIENKENANDRAVCESEKEQKDGGTKAKVKYELPADCVRVLRDVLKKKHFAEIKFVEQLDLHQRALEIGQTDLRIKEKKLGSYLSCIVKKIKTETAIVRCQILRAIKGKFERKYK